VAGVEVDGVRPFRDPKADRLGPSGPLIREHLRVLAGTGFAGWIVGAVGGGIIGRLVMRLLVLTSDDRVDGAITDDEAVVNQFTFGGSAGLLLFLAIGGMVLAWLYVGARASMPPSVRGRAAIWAVLTWSVVGSAVFDPDGFDFTQLTPIWLGVLAFSALILVMGALIALGAERAIERWPSRKVALLPFVLMGPMFPVLAGGVVAAVGSELNEKYRAVRIFGAIVMLAIALLVGVPAFVNVLRILF
jgi:hypothetical protein